MSEKILDSVIAAIAKQKQLEPGLIKSTSSMDELGVSSLDAITIIFDMEEEFDIQVPSGVLEDLSSVQDIVDGIDGLIKKV